MSMAVPTYWTAEMVRQLPDDGRRYEVVHGELPVIETERVVWHRSEPRRRSAGRNIVEVPTSSVSALDSPDHFGGQDIAHCQSSLDRPGQPDSRDGRGRQDERRPQG